MGDSPTQTSTSTPTLDPDIKARLLGNLDTANALTSGVLPQLKTGTGTGGQTVTGPDGSTINIGGGSTGASPADYVNADGTPYKAPTSLTAGFTPDQQLAFQGIRDLQAGNPGPDSYGQKTFSDLAQFNAPTVSAPTMTAGQVGQVGDVTSKNFTDYDVSKYMNPALAQVVNPVQDYFNTQSDRAAAAAQGQARAAGALRGSSPAIGTALARGEVAQQAGMALSPLYENAYNTAAGLVNDDANRNLTGQQSNQNTQLTRATTQAGLDTTAAADNQDAALKAGLANQTGAISSADVRNAGAAGVANATNNYLNNALTFTSALGNVGAQEQAQDQAKIDDPFKALQLRSGMVNSAVPGSTGQTSTSTGGGPGIGGTLGGIGTAALGLSKLIPLL